MILFIYSAGIQHGQGGCLTKRQARLRAGLHCSRGQSEEQSDGGYIKIKGEFAEATICNQDTSEYLGTQNSQLMTLLKI